MPLKCRVQQRFQPTQLAQQVSGGPSKNLSRRGFEILEPEGLRQSIIDFADQISAVYEGSSSW